MGRLPVSERTMKIKFSTISIYGRNEIKQIIQMALNSEQPVHVLLTGEPGCGKTQFLENIKEYYKHRAYFYYWPTLQRQA